MAAHPVYSMRTRASVSAAIARAGGAQSPDRDPKVVGVPSQGERLKLAAWSAADVDCKRSGLCGPQASHQSEQKARESRAERDA